jgi:ABC-2 type transport system ATP-binding protein
MNDVITCEHLNHSYGTKQVLHDISWSLPKGRICGLLGRNGAGKTTTINILNSFLTPTSGRCLLLGEPSHALSHNAKKQIGYLIEGHVQYSFMNVHQIERFYSKFYENWDPKIYFHLISKLDITPTQKISTMSCGQRSQVALGLILAQDPSLIIFDDYSMGLDPGYRRLFIDVIKEYAAADHRSILLTSHIIQDLEHLIDDCIIYDKGHLIANTSLSEFSKNYRSYSFESAQAIEPSFDRTTGTRIEKLKSEYTISGYLSEEEANTALNQKGISAKVHNAIPMSLEDAFIALTGKY